MSNSLLTHACPSGYCVCTPLNTSGILKCTHIFDDEEPDSQCHSNRTGKYKGYFSVLWHACCLLGVGVLCGDCADGFGFSALLDSCVECSNAYSAVIVLLAVVDVAVIVALLVVSKPVPLFFYPVLFHLQLLPYFTTHFPVTFEKVRLYLVYVASALGLYFPYDFCLYKEASALAVYSFRYLPLLLAVVIIPFAVTIRRRCSPKNTWHGVWWLLLLLYTPAVHTSFAVLHCPSLPGPDSNSTRISTEPRWFVNGNIQCFTGAHIPLGLLAIVILVFGIVLPALLLVAVFVEEKQFARPRWFELAVEGLQQSFRYLWWGALELFRRFVLVLLAVVFPRNNYPVIFTLFVLTGLTSFVKPYGNKDSHKKGYAWVVNVLDMFLASNVLILMLLRNTESVEENYEQFDSSIQDQQLGPAAGLQRTSATYNGLTHFAIILMPIYYLPLLVSIVALVVWLCSISTAAFTTKQKPVTVNLGDQEDSRDVASARRRTETIIDFRSYDPDQPNSPKYFIKSPAASLSPAGKIQKYFSFRRMSSRIRRKSKEGSCTQVVEKEETKSKSTEKESGVELKEMGGWHALDFNGRRLKQNYHPSCATIMQEENSFTYI